MALHVVQNPARVGVKDGRPPVITDTGQPGAPALRAHERRQALHLDGEGKKGGGSRRVFPPLGGVPQIIHFL
jgi:hypothetical protein